jgi:hypothetical protein
MNCIFKELEFILIIQSPKWVFKKSQKMNMQLQLRGSPAKPSSSAQSTGQEFLPSPP